MKRPIKRSVQKRSVALKQQQENRFSNSFGLASVKQASQEKNMVIVVKAEPKLSGTQIGT